MDNPIEKAIIKLLKIVGKFALFALITVIIALSCTAALLLLVDQNELFTALSSSLTAENITYNSLFYSCIAIGQLLAMLLIYQLIEQKPFSAMGFGRKDSLRQFSIGAAWGIGLIGGIFLLLLATGLIQIESVQFHWLTLFEFALFFVLVALTEELIFRPFAINMLSDAYGDWAALIVSSILFALVHTSNPSYDWIPFVSIFLGGVVMGILYLKTRQIWYPLGFHLTWNFFQGNIFGFEVSGLSTNSLLTVSKSDYPLLTGGDFGLEGSILGVLALCACIAYYRADLKKIVERKELVTND